MLEAAELKTARARMPHGGKMQLIEQIARIDTVQIQCVSRHHAAPEYPLRLDGVLYASALVELGAQAAAAHASVHGMGGAHSGLILSVNDLRMHAVCVNDLVLEVTATLDESMDGAARYSFVVCGTQNLIEGHLLLSMQMRSE